MSRRLHAPTFIRDRDDTGSMILALLASVIVLALLTVIASTAALGQVASRHDRNFTTAFQVADAGVQRVLFELNAANTSAGVIPANYPTSKVTGSFSGGTYAAYAQKLTGSRQWTIYSTGVQNGVSRSSAVTVLEDQLFFASAFADTSIAFNGGNVADTYDSSTSPGTAHGPGVYGLVGSNGNVNFLGNSSSVDGVDLYNYVAPNDVLATRCTGNATLGLRPDLVACGASSNTTLNPIGLPYQQHLTQTRLLVPSTGDLTASATAACGAGPYSNVSIGGSALAPGTYCYNDVTFNTNSVLAASATTANPVKLYVTGNVTANGNKTVNCALCDTTPTATPVAGALQIYMAGTATTFTAGSQTKMGMAVYAPGSTCGGNAGDDIYGSLICKAITNVGNWGFHYDKALANVGAGHFTILDYQES